MYKETTNYKAKENHYVSLMTSKLEFPSQHWTRIGHTVWKEEVKELFHPPIIRLIVPFPSLILFPTKQAKHQLVTKTEITTSKSCTA